MLDNLPLSAAADKRNGVQFNERTANRDLEKEKRLFGTLNRNIQRKRRKLPLAYRIMREHLHRSFRKYQAFQYENIRNGMIRLTAAKAVFPT